MNADVTETRSIRRFAMLCATVAVGLVLGTIWATSANRAWFALAILIFWRVYVFLRNLWCYTRPALFAWSMMFLMCSALVFGFGSFMSIPPVSKYHETVALFGGQDMSGRPKIHDERGTLLEPTWPPSRDGAFHGLQPGERLKVRIEEYRRGVLVWQVVHGGTVIVSYDDATAGWREGRSVFDAAALVLALGGLLLSVQWTRSARFDLDGAKTRS